MKKNGKKQICAYSLGGVLLVIVLVVIIVLLVVGGISFNIDSCEDIPVPSSVLRKSAAPQYSDVITDLSKDETFAAEDYPEREGDYSLAVIQIAESAEKALFVYAYQPSGESLTATEIRISTGINDNVRYSDYMLESVSKSGTLHKYIVTNFEVKPDALRYYDVAQISRAWSENIDSVPDGGNTAETVAYPVGQLWTASTVDGTVTYTMIESEVITVTDKRVGQLYYSNGFLFGKSTCYRHYVAFSADRDIERLMEADLTYVAMDYTLRHFYEPPALQYISTSEPRTESVTLEADSKGGNTGGHLYTWKRIQSVNEFLADKERPEITDTAKDELKSMKWILSFIETDVTIKTHGIFSYNDEIGTKISDVTILRLKFETDGTVYNLGVVDNKQTGSDEPDNNGRQKTWWEKLLRFIVELPFTALDWISHNWVIVVIALASLLGLFLLGTIIRFLTLVFGKS